MTPRERWKKAWRYIRVARRESRKARTDLLLYGTGAVLVPNNGADPCHIPLEQIRLEKQPAPVVAP